MRCSGLDYLGFYRPSWLTPTTLLDDFGVIVKKRKGTRRRAWAGDLQRTQIVRFASRTGTEPTESVNLSAPLPLAGMVTATSQTPEIEPGNPVAFLNTFTPLSAVPFRDAPNR